MLKKHSKLVVLLVIATFLFSFVASAGAAAFSDVSGTSPEAAAIYKLNSLGIIDGYPDGTFGADNTITRAEFAKIAVYTAGLQNVASGMKASPSTFKDVATSEWYNGWVNVAASQGFVKGYSDGKFYPDKEVTQAEAITVLLRILGYNDNLAGNWPSDYIGKAATLGLMDDVTFDAYGPATRGVVSVFASETLDQDIVVYRASDNVFEDPAGGAKTLLQDKFKDWNNLVEEMLVTDVNLSNGKVVLTVKEMDTDIDNATAGTTENGFKPGASTTITVDKDCVFANGSFWGSAAFRFIDYIVNDDNKVAYIKVLDNEVIKGVTPDDVTVVDGNSIKIDDKTYKFAAKFGTSDVIASPTYNVDPQQLAGAFNVYDLLTNSGTSAGGAGDFDALPTAASAFSTVKAPAVSAALAAAGQAAKAAIVTQMINPGSFASAVDGADFVLNSDGDIAYVRIYGYPTNGVYQNPTIQKAGIVKETVAKSGKINFLGGATSQTLDPDDPDAYYITKDGAPATFADIKAGDLVYVLNKFGLTNSSNEGGFIIAMNATVKGKLNSYETGTFPFFKTLAGTPNIVKKVTVGDKKYNIAPGGTYLLSTDGGDSFALPTQTLGTTDFVGDIDDVLDKDVTIYLNPVGEIAAIVANEAGDGNSIYGMVNDICSYTAGPPVVIGEELKTMGPKGVQRAVEVLKADGSLASYTYDSDSETKIGGAAQVALDTNNLTAQNFPKGTLVQITLNSKGYIDTLKTGSAMSGGTYSAVAAALTGDKDTSVVNVGASSFDGAKTVVFNGVAGWADDAEIVKPADFLDAVDGTTGIIIGNIASLEYIYKDGVLKYVAIVSTLAAGGIGGKGNVAMISGTGTDSTDDYVYFLNKDGSTKKLYVTGSDAAAVAKSNLVYYDLVNGDAKILAWDNAAVTWNLEYLTTVDTLTVTSKNGNIITGTVLGVTKQYSVDSDTVFFDTTEDDPTAITIDDIGIGDNLKVWRETAGEALDAVVVD